MKIKYLLIIAMFIMSCGGRSSADKMVYENDSIITEGEEYSIITDGEEYWLLNTDTNMINEAHVFLDTQLISIDTSRDLNKKEQFVLAQREYDTMQKNVMNQIEILEKQQIQLDSILKIKKKNGGNK